MQSKKGPLFQFPADKAFLESPDQWLSPKVYFTSFAYTHTGSKCARLSAPLESYRPRSRGPLFHFPASKAFLEGPNQWVSPELYFQSFGHTRPEFWRLQMCSTIRPLPGALYFSFLQVKKKESPDQWLSLELYCRSFAHTHTEV